MSSTLATLVRRATPFYPVSGRDDEVVGAASSWWNQRFDSTRINRASSRIVDELEADELTAGKLEHREAAEL